MQGEGQGGSEPGRPWGPPSAPLPACPPVTAACPRTPCSSPAAASTPASRGKCPDLLTAAGAPPRALGGPGRCELWTRRRFRCRVCAHGCVVFKQKRGLGRARERAARRTSRGSQWFRNIVTVVTTHERDPDATLRSGDSEAEPRTGRGLTALGRVREAQTPLLSVSGRNWGPLRSRTWRLWEAFFGGRAFKPWKCVD